MVLACVDGLRADFPFSEVARAAVICNKNADSDAASYSFLLQRRDKYRDHVSAVSDATKDAARYSGSKAAAAGSAILFTPHAHQSDATRALPARPACEPRTAEEQKRSRGVTRWVCGLPPRPPRGWPTAALPFAPRHTSEDTRARARGEGWPSRRTKTCFPVFGAGHIERRRPPTASTPPPRGKPAQQKLRPPSTVGAAARSTHEQNTRAMALPTYGAVPKQEIPKINWRRRLRRAAVCAGAGLICRGPS